MSALTAQRGGKPPVQPSFSYCRSAQLQVTRQQVGGRQLGFKAKLMQEFMVKEFLRFFSENPEAPKTCLVFSLVLISPKHRLLFPHFVIAGSVWYLQQRDF